MSIKNIHFIIDFFVRKKLLYIVRYKIYYIEVAHVLMVHDFVFNWVNI